MSVGSGVLPVVHDNRKKKPPDATAGCNDREPAAGVREGEGDAGRWTEAGRGLSPLGRQVPAGINECRMAEAVDRRRDTLDAGAMRDRRNGTCRRCLPSELGDIERDVPRTRHFCPTGVPKGSARRAPEIDRAIPAGFVPGLSTRKVGEVLLALPGRPVPDATVS